ncbi:hypothetical protein PYW08_009041 [Mythimna loreyi]|uniref:Uncharacterized protein n=1 Tax=Mythimna loreyi TaxID=667449 RepID=A0ACC2Q7J0_9NEOP|nr:hypothetical protein PYW08_009041 [Mythimna loreyi]
MAAIVDAGNASAGLDVAYTAFKTKPQTNMQRGHDIGKPVVVLVYTNFWVTPEPVQTDGRWVTLAPVQNHRPWPLGKTSAGPDPQRPWQLGKTSAGPNPQRPWQLGKTSAGPNPQRPLAAG